MELSNALNWFEIPVVNFERAKIFYETLFQYQMPESTVGDARMGFFLHDMDGGKVGGAIVYQPELMQPSMQGTVVYLNCQPDLQLVLDRVVNAGGEILVEKTLISPDQHLGYWAMMKDTEGNRVALHSIG